MIKVSRIWDYSLRSVIYIASKWEMVKIKDISEDQHISESLLRRLVATLEKAWILKTIKGRNGWVMLARKTEEISMHDIFSAVDEEMSICKCTNGWECDIVDKCLTANAYKAMQITFNTVLKSQTLDKILNLNGK